MHGSVEYSLTRAHGSATPDTRLHAACSIAVGAARSIAERIHDVATSIETEVPETVDARRRALSRQQRVRAAGDRSRQAPALDARFDVQVRQSLPFMDFSSAKWEMLVAVRNFFRETAADQSVYDELLVVRPPKRIVGGLTLQF